MSKKRRATNGYRGAAGNSRPALEEFLDAGRSFDLRAALEACVSRPAAIPATDASLESIESICCGLIEHLRAQKLSVWAGFMGVLKNDWGLEERGREKQRQGDLQSIDSTTILNGTRARSRRAAVYDFYQTRIDRRSRANRVRDWRTSSISLT
jgi:hypothetical protein